MPCSSLATQFVLPGNRTCRFLGLALHVFDDELYSSFGTDVLVLTIFILLFVLFPVCVPKEPPKQKDIGNDDTDTSRMQQVSIGPVVGRVPS